MKVSYFVIRVRELPLLKLLRLSVQLMQEMRLQALYGERLSYRVGRFKGRFDESRYVSLLTLSESERRTIFGELIVDEKVRE